MCACVHVLVISMHVSCKPRKSPHVWSFVVSLVPMCACIGSHVCMYWFPCVGACVCVCMHVHVLVPMCACIGSHVCMYWFPCVGARVCVCLCDRAHYYLVHLFQ